MEKEREWVTFSRGTRDRFSSFSSVFAGALPSKSSHTGSTAVPMLIAQKALDTRSVRIGESSLVVYLCIPGRIALMNVDHPADDHRGHEGAETEAEMHGCTSAVRRNGTRRPVCVVSCCACREVVVRGVRVRTLKVGSDIVAVKSNDADVASRIEEAHTAFCDV